MGRCFVQPLAPKRILVTRVWNALGFWDANPPRPHASALRYSLRGHKLYRAPNVWDAVLCRLWRQRALWSLEFGTLQLNPTQRPWQLQRVHSNWPQSAQHVWWRSKPFSCTGHYLCAGMVGMSRDEHPHCEKQARQQQFYPQHFFILFRCLRKERQNHFAHSAVRPPSPPSSKLKLQRT